MRTTVGEFIIDRLKAIGITEIVGVPGDFNLSFLEQVRDAEGIRFVGTCNELNAAYAADGYARQRGVGCLLTTYGVGELSAINGIAGARAEHVPVVSLAGAPPLYATEYRWAMHHSLADGDYANMLEAIAPFTEVACRVTPMNVVEEFDRALHTCLREKRPVHIQIPSDITHLTIEVPDEPFSTALASSDTERLEAAADAVLKRFAEAKDPIFLLDQDTDRHGFTEKFRAIIEKTQLPYSQLTSGKALLSERHPLFLGVYNGSASAPGVQERVENSDFLVTTNPRFIEVNSGSYTHHLPEKNIVNFGDQHALVAGEYFVGINTLELLAILLEKLPAVQAPAASEQVEVPEFVVDKQAPLTQARMWPHFVSHLEENGVVIAEAGTSNIGLGPLRMPAGTQYINSPIWGSIGFTLPALLGSMLAAPERRHVLFIGDGSFQLTAQELSTIVREELKPLIVLVNNKGYTIERFILGMEDEYNDIQDWSYAELPKVFMRDTTMKSYVARTEGELEEALQQIAKSDDGAFLEVHLDPFDAPRGLQAFGPLTAEFDYGPRGPRNP
ncbi:alpha-keto acid decarboxylase family protein [Corynebacterium epidermidicanis]|uniref:Alpha-keto-acid decarboxylase n=1 Tax=Corynebacterium epidermidicanis TaxID=1050174 RepID=A0A0G3GRE5_9CORY|nr:thiamine pyrophosphate-binding protein [Corynebacterium epidermidicanis]AKK03689.1 thiamine pyrophosphate dependent decarboxylase, pyruvate decarboxylase [Corynebacterium epidermidicanis]